MGLVLPRLYAIVDREALDARALGVRAFAAKLREAGVRLVQYRDKRGSPQRVLKAAAEISDVFAGSGATLILNDRADLCVLAGWDGVHVGQGDVPPTAVRRVVGAERIVGVSTHNEQQILPHRFPQAQDDNASAVDYVAIGPVFATGSKPDAEPVVGLEGVRRARALTTKPLVAIGGITAENARGVIEAGADCVAVIGVLLPANGGTARERIRAIVACLA